MWVLVADSAVGRIFRAPTSSGNLEEFESLTHSASRLHGRELGSDRPGRTYDRVGGGRHATEPRTDPTEVESARFAEQLASRLNAARAGGEFQRLMLVAAPHFLGMLRKNLDPATRASVTLELDQDLTRFSPDEIRKHLPDHLY